MSLDPFLLNFHMVFLELIDYKKIYVLWQLLAGFAAFSPPQLAFCGGSENAVVTTAARQWQFF